MRLAPCINPFVASDGRPVPDLPRLGWSYKQTCGDLLPLRKHTAGRDRRTSLSIDAVEIVCRDGTGRALWCRTRVREVHGVACWPILERKTFARAAGNAKPRRPQRTSGPPRGQAQDADTLAPGATPTLQVVENPDLVQNVAEFLDEDGCNRALVCHGTERDPDRSLAPGRGPPPRRSGAAS